MTASRFTTLAFAAVLLSSCQHTPAPDTEAHHEGHALAQAACGGCHMVEAYGLSPNAQAPEWPVIANTPGLTRDTLLTWLTQAHNYPEQMDFYLDQDEAELLADYMLTLRREDFHPPY